MDSIPESYFANFAMYDIWLVFQDVMFFSCRCEHDPDNCGDSRVCHNSPPYGVIHRSDEDGFPPFRQQKVSGLAVANFCRCAVALRPTPHSASPVHSFACLFRKHHPLHTCSLWQLKCFAGKLSYLC